MLVEQPSSENGAAEGGFVFDATVARLEGELELEEVESLIRRLSVSEGLTNDDRACVVYGYGSQTSALYDELGRVDGVDVLWHANCGPWWMAPLLWVAASRYGLIRVETAKVVPDVFGALAVNAMVGLYSFPRRLMSSVEGHVHENRWRSEVGRVVGRDPSYFCFGVDGDSYHVASGIFGWSSYGAECPAELRAAVSPRDVRA